MSESHANNVNVQCEIGLRADLPNPLRITGGDFFLARDTRELFILNRDPTGVEAPFWELISGEGGIVVKGSVLTASTAPLPSYIATADVLTATVNGALPAIGGVVPPTGARVLIKNEPGALAANDGIFDVIQGDLTHPWMLVRSDDAVQGELVSGSMVFVETGALAGTNWILVTPDPIIVGTTLQQWNQFAGPGTFTATAPIILTGTDFSFAGTDVSAAGVVQHFTLASDSDANGHEINNLPAPVAGGDAANKTYVDSQVSSLTGSSIKQFRIPIALGTPVTSTASIPANSLVYRCAIQVDTPYSAGTTITVGRAGSLALLQVASDSELAAAIPFGDTYNTFEEVQDTPWGASDLPIVITIGGAPVAGSGFVIVEYVSLPST